MDKSKVYFLQIACVHSQLCLCIHQLCLPSIWYYVFRHKSIVFFRYISHGFLPHFNMTVWCIFSVDEGQCNTKATGDILATTERNESWPVFTPVYNKRGECPALCSYWGIHRPCKASSSPRICQPVVGKESQGHVSHSDCTRKEEFWHRRDSTERHKRQVEIYTIISWKYAHW